VANVFHGHRLDVWCLSDFRTAKDTQVVDISRACQEEKFLNKKTAALFRLLIFI